MRLPDKFRDRTKRFASAIIRLYTQLPNTRKEVQVLGHQLLRSGTSVAAHVREASRARSAAEFCSKIDGALQEADEAQLWVELLREDCGINGVAIDQVHQETNELIAILTTMASKTRRGLE